MIHEREVCETSNHSRLEIMLLWAGISFQSKNWPLLSGFRLER